MAWQSGFTGIGWNTKYVQKEITSFMDLFDSEYSGHIGMFGDPADLPNMAIMAAGFDPGTSTPDQWQQAADLLQQQKDSGVVRKYYVQDYLEAFENEDIWLTMAWSGDILIDKLYYPDDFGTFEFTLPSEGGIIWTDNMCIPKHSTNPVGALKLMDHWYDPRTAATLTEYNNYVSPVPAGKPLIEKDAKAETDPDYKSILEAVLSSPYVFPDQQIESMVHRYRVLTADEEQQWNDIFTPIYQG
jgi:spermidine/putrescine transport system substrate-binding protein